MQHWHLRQAAAGDAPAIEALFLEMLYAIYGKPAEAGYEAGYLDKFFSGGRDRIFAAEAEGRVIGYLSAEVYEGCMYLDDCCVAEGFRGRGIGTAFLSAAEAYAKSLSLPVVVLHAEKENRRAAALYERLGFSVFAEEGSRLKMIKRI